MDGIVFMIVTSLGMLKKTLLFHYFTVLVSHFRYCMQSYVQPVPELLYTM